LGNTTRGRLVAEALHARGGVMSGRLTIHNPFKG